MMHLYNLHDVPVRVDIDAFEIDAGVIDVFPAVTLDNDAFV
jgi:hypothetical protein